MKDKYQEWANTGTILSDTDGRLFLLSNTDKKYWNPIRQSYNSTLQYMLSTLSGGSLLAADKETDLVSTGYTESEFYAECDRRVPGFSNAPFGFSPLILSAENLSQVMRKSYLYIFPSPSISDISGMAFQYFLINWLFKPVHIIPLEEMVARYWFANGIRNMTPQHCAIALRQDFWGIASKSLISDFWTCLPYRVGVYEPYKFSGFREQKRDRPYLPLCLSLDCILQLLLENNEQT